MFSQSTKRIGQFAKGDVNLLISTVVAEEGMDIPAANCIIRFDPLQTPVSLIQGRGRARQEASSFVVMEEREDRTVEKLGKAEHAQMNLLKNSGVVLKNMDEEDKKRKMAQKSRENSGKQLLESKKGHITTVVKAFCTRTDRETVEAFKMTTKGWQATVSVMGFEGEKVMAEVVMASKQDAKANAYEQIYQHYCNMYGIK